MTDSTGLPIRRRTLLATALGVGGAVVASQLIGGSTDSPASTPAGPGTGSYGSGRYGEGGYGT